MVTFVYGLFGFLKHTVVPTETQQNNGNESVFPSGKNLEPDENVIMETTIPRGHGCFSPVYGKKMSKCLIFICSLLIFLITVAFFRELI